MKKLARLENARTTYSVKVHEFLKNCKSCKQMLELMPSSYAWLPDVEGCSDVSVADLASEVANL